MKPTLTALLLTAILSLNFTSMAGDFSPARVSDKAHWVAHANLDEFWQTKISAGLFKMLLNGDHAAKYNAFKTLLQLDPQKDFHGITAYGLSEDEKDAVILLDASYKQDVILALLKVNSKYLEDHYEGYTLYRFEGDHNKGGQTVKNIGWLAMYGNQTLIYSQSAQRVKDSLDILDRKKKSLAGSKGKLSIPTSPYFLAASVDMESVSTSSQQAALLENARSLALTLDENKDELVCNLAVVATSQETAGALTDMVNGLVAVSKLTAQNDPANAWLMDLTEKLDVTKNGDNVSLSVSMPVERVLEHINKAK